MSEPNQNNKNKTIIGVIVQAGAVGIALVAVYFMYNLASNHINRNTEVLIELKGVIENNSNVLGSVENALEELDRTIQINFKK